MHNKGMGWTRTGVTEVYAQSLNLDLCPSDMGLNRDTSYCHDEHLIHFFLNPTMHNKVMGRTRTGFTEVYAQSLSAVVDVGI